MAASSLQAIRHTVSLPANAMLSDDKSKLRHRLVHGTSATGAALMLFKIIVGASLFALPYAFSQMGLGGGVIAMFGETTTPDLEIARLASRPPQRPSAVPPLVSHAA